MSFFWGHWYSCLGPLMKTSALGFKTRVDASLVCFVRTDATDSTPVSTPAYLKVASIAAEPF